MLPGSLERRTVLFRFQVAAWFLLISKPTFFIFKFSRVLIFANPWLLANISRVLIFANFRELVILAYFAGINFREFSRIFTKFRELIPAKINTRENLCTRKLIPLSQQKWNFRLIFIYVFLHVIVEIGKNTLWNIFQQTWSIINSEKSKLEKMR